MLRFIMRSHRHAANWGTDCVQYYTLDIDVPELEAALSRGGYGETGFERHDLIGVEIMTAEAGEGDQ